MNADTDLLIHMRDGKFSTGDYLFTDEARATADRLLTRLAELEAENERLTEMLTRQACLEATTADLWRTACAERDKYRAMAEWLANEASNHRGELPERRLWSKADWLAAAREATS